MVEAWALVVDGVVVDSRDADTLVPWWSFTKTVLATAALVLVRDASPVWMSRSEASPTPCVTCSSIDQGWQITAVFVLIMRPSSAATILGRSRNS